MPPGSHLARPVGPLIHTCFFSWLACTALRWTHSFNSVNNSNYAALSVSVFSSFVEVGKNLTRPTDVMQGGIMPQKLLINPS